MQIIKIRMISQNDIEELGEDLIKYRNQFVHSEFGKISLLGPIGKEALYRGICGSKKI